MKGDSQNSSSSNNSTAKDTNQVQQNVPAATENSSAKTKDDPANTDSKQKAQPELKVSHQQVGLDKDKAVAPKTNTVNDTTRYTEATKTIKSDEILKEISKFIEQGDKKSIVLKVVPEELGKVKVTVDMVDKMVHAKIEVENDNVKQIVQSQLDNLKSSLNQNGVQLNAINVSLSNSEQKSNKAFEPKKKQFYADKTAKIDETAQQPAKIKKMGYNTYDFIA